MAGLTSIRLLSERLRKVDTLIPVILDQSVREFAPIIEDLNIAQLQKGQRADNSFLPDYSPVSVAKYGKPKGPIKLYDTGAFYRGITLEGNKSGFNLVGQDNKTPKLTEAYGDNILGLSKESLSELKDGYLLEELRVKIKDYLVYGTE